MTLLSRGVKSAPIPLMGRSGNPRGYGLPVVEYGALQLSDRTYMSYAGLYQSQPWVNTVVNKLSRGIARLPLLAFEGDPDDEVRLRAMAGPLKQLARRPMGDGISAFEWKAALVGHVALYGSCVVIKQQASYDAPATELWPFTPLGWRVEADGTYVYRPWGGGDEVSFPPWRVWQPQFWSPHPAGFGLSPLEPLRLTLSLEDAGRRLGIASFANGVRPSGALTVKTPNGNALKDEVIQRLAASVKRLHSGVDNAFKPIILEGDFSWLPMSHSLDESAVVAHRKLTREEVAAVYDLPQSSIGILDNSNFASVDAFHIMLYQDSYGPWLSMLEEGFAANVIDGVPEMAGQFVAFDLDRVMRGDMASRFAAYQRALPWMTPNEMRDRENLPRRSDPDADSLHFPHGVAPDAAQLEGQTLPGQNTKAIAMNGAH